MGNSLSISKSEGGLIFKPSIPRELPWERDAADKFSKLMLDDERPFPCIYGVDAFKTESLRYAFIPQEDGSEAQLAAALREFVGQAHSLGQRASLVAFFDQTSDRHTLEDYRELFWTTLQKLHALDEEPWPADVPTDTDNEWWEFCFAGMKLFVVGNTPAYEFRASRHFDYFNLTFQPRFVFDDITDKTPHGRNGRKIIRERLHSYDKIGPTPALGDFGTPGIREWRQYFLEDDNEPLSTTERCPFENGKN
jgi:FPC/CPF motif-containing protein YcgG